MSVRAGESLVLCDIFRGRFLLCAQNRDRRDLGTEDNQAVAGWHSVTQAPAAPGPGALDQVPSLDDISGGLEHSSKSTWEMLDLTSAEKQLHWSQGRKKEFCEFYLCLALLPKYLDSLATQSEMRRGGKQERSSRRVPPGIGWNVQVAYGKESLTVKVMGQTTQGVQD